MPQDDEAYYRRQAEDAQKQADRALTERDHANWLRLAQSWMSLIKGRARTSQETFDDAAEAQGTRQDISKESQ
jgi:hypothetical protein